MVAFRFKSFYFWLWLNFGWICIVIIFLFFTSQSHVLFCFVLLFCGFKNRYPKHHLKICAPIKFLSFYFLLLFLF